MFEGITLAGACNAHEPSFACITQQSVAEAVKVLKAREVESVEIRESENQEVGEVEVQVQPA